MALSSPFFSSTSLSLVGTAYAIPMGGGSSFFGSGLPALPTFSLPGMPVLPAGLPKAMAALAAKGAIVIGLAATIVLATASPTGSLTLTSPPVASPKAVKKTTSKGKTITTYKIKAEDPPVYHNWGGAAGKNQKAYLGAVPNMDKIVWPYTPAGGDGTVLNFGIDMGWGLRDSLKRWFGITSRGDLTGYWTDLGYSPLPLDPPVNNYEYVWDGYGYIEKGKPDTSYEGYYHDVPFDLAIMPYVFGSFAHAYAQMGKAVGPSGDIVGTFSLVRSSLMLVLAPATEFAMGPDWLIDLPHEIRLKWNKDFWFMDLDTLREVAFVESKGLTRDPMTAIDSLISKYPDREAVIWEKVPAASAAVPAASAAVPVPYVKTKTKKKKMPCCNAKQCAEILRLLRKYLAHDIKGVYPPICEEEGTKNPVTGEPYDWNNPLVISAAKANPKSFKESFNSPGLKGIAELIETVVEQRNTAISTDQALSLWCEPKKFETTTLGTITGEDGYIYPLPKNSIFVKVRIKEYDKLIVKGHKLPPSKAFSLPEEAWFGSVSFVDKDGLFGPKHEVSQYPGNWFNLPFSEGRVCVWVNDGVTAEVEVRKVKSKP